MFRGAYIHYFRINTLIFCWSISFEECPNPKDQQNGKRIKLLIILVLQNWLQGCISSLAVQLCREDMKYFNFFNVTVYQNTYSFFLRSFSLAFMHWYVQFINQGFKCFRVNFFILKFHCFMFLLNFITSKYSFFRQKRC